MALKDQECVPCQGGVPKLEQPKIDELLNQVEGWRVEDNKLHKQFTFENFVKAIEFINRMADTAESQGHHPDFCVHYNQVDVTIWTHKIGGLTESDFILAAKIDELA